jgi:heme/copper-type cytochrome/quinol oxidase subunit 2
MKNRLFRILATAVLAAFLVGGSLADTADACPMCKAATEGDNAQAKAYMYSILFMLTVPGLIIGGLTASLIRLGRREAKAMKEFELAEELASQQPRAQLKSQTKELVEV